jgi:hypothetical protein
MTAANIRLDEIDDDGADPNFAPEDHLATTKMPAIGQRPLPQARVPSAPPSPPPIVSAPAGGSSPTIPPPPPTVGGPLPSVPPPLYASAAERTSEEPAPPKLLPDAPRAAPSSWWRALLASAVPPARDAGNQVLAQSLRLRLAGLAAGLGLLSFIVAFVVGFHGPPADLLMSSTVAASIVLAHAFMGVGLLAVGLGLLRAAERLAFARPLRERDGDR